jgi:hypothetical protein
LRDANARTFIDAPKPDQALKELGNNGEQQVKSSASWRPAIYKFLSCFQSPCANMLGFTIPQTLVATADDLFAAPREVLLWDKANIRQVQLTSAFGGKADIDARPENVRF